MKTLGFSVENKNEVGSILEHEYQYKKVYGVFTFWPKINILQENCYSEKIVVCTVKSRLRKILRVTRIFLKSRFLLFQTQENP